MRANGGRTRWRHTEHAGGGRSQLLRHTVRANRRMQSAAGGGSTPPSSSSSTSPPMPALAGGRNSSAAGCGTGTGRSSCRWNPRRPSRLRGGDAAVGNSPGQRQQLSPGLLDLHAFDTELIPDFQVPGMYDGAGKFSYGGGLDDSEMSFAANKQMSKYTIFTENSYVKAFPDKEKAAPVAKIKVLVRKRPHGAQTLKVAHGACGCSVQAAAVHGASRWPRCALLQLSLHLFILCSVSA